MISSNQFSIYLNSLKSNVNIHFIIFSIIFWVCVLIVTPFQETGFLDDFAYAQSVKRLIVDNQLAVSEWSDPSLVFQIIGGAAFSSILGFSFKTLHLFTLSTLWLGLASFFFTLKLLKISDFNALVFVLFLMSVPWFFFYGFSFSTDVPFASVQMIAVYFFIKGLQRDSIKNLFYSSLFISFCFLIRQIGIAIFLAGIASLIWSNKDSTKNILMKVLVLGLFPLITFIAYSLWLEGGNYSVNQLILRKKILDETLPSLFFINIQNTLSAYNLIFHRLVFYASELLGFIFLFFLVLRFPIRFKLIFQSKIFKQVVLITGIAVLTFLVDILFNFHRFGLYVPGVPIRYLKYEELFSLPWPVLWKYMVLAGIIFLSYLISAYSRNKVIGNKIKSSNPKMMFIISSILIQLLLITLAKEMYAEYVIPIIPLVVILLVILLGRAPMPKYFALTVVLFLIVDMLQLAKLNYHLNGIKWSQGLELVRQGIDPNYIDIRNYAWPRYFLYEEWINNEIVKAGEKAKVKSAYYEWITPPKYVIFSEFDSVKNKGETLKVIHKKIMFINSTIYVNQLY